MYKDCNMRKSNGIISNKNFNKNWNQNENDNYNYNDTKLEII
jgi:hypothetical protein